MGTALTQEVAGGAWAEWPQEHAVERKESRGKQLHGVGVPSAQRRGHSAASPSARFTARPVETSRPEGFSWEGSRLWLLGHLRNLQHKQKEKLC